MKKLLALVLALALMLPCLSTLAEEDAFDMTADQETVAELGIPTVSTVAALKAEADKLWAAQDYSAAAAAYATYAKQANWLANLISAGLDPFYTASSSDRKGWSPSVLSWNDLTGPENSANDYKAERNRAILQHGLCYYNLGDYENALPLLLKALDLIELDQESYWKDAMAALYAIIGY